MQLQRLYSLTYGELRDFAEWVLTTPSQSTDIVVLISAANVTKGTKADDYQTILPLTCPSTAHIPPCMGEHARPS